MPENLPRPTPPIPELQRLTGEDATRLFEALTVELRRVAGCIAAGEVGHTLQPTALVNEAYLKMFGGRPRSWNDQVHFMRSAAVTMRCILIDHKRRRPPQERAVLETECALNELLDGMESRCGGDLLAVHEGLERLADEDPQIADYVTLRFFGGRTNLETTRILGISERNGERLWAFARSWLKTRLQP